MRDLLDVSVWLPLSAPDHIHHLRARRYWDEEASDELAFCRITALALLRLLTNRHILGDAVLNGESAWRALETWLAQSRITFISEPAGINELLEHWAGRFDLRGARWTDAYLAAFAAAGDCRLVTFDGAFDSDFRVYPGVEFLHLGR